MPKILTIIFIIPAVFFVLPLQTFAAPQISNITDNKNTYSQSAVPIYEKLEITAAISTAATNLFFPYAESVPAGLTPGIGITVNGQFLPPGETNWVNSFTVPAFYYQDFDYQVKENKDWLHANGNFAWKIRFAPNRIGTWQYRLTALDSTGNSTSSIFSFNVTDSASHGFIKVSSRDSRYFEFDDGTFFPALGINMNYRDIDWVNPVLGNQTKMQNLKQKGIQLIRIWQSQWAIFGSFWNPWHYINSLADYTWLTGRVSYQPNDFSIYLNRGLAEDSNPCISFGGWETYTPAVKPNTTYRVRARVKTTQMGTAINSTAPFGLVIKAGGWLDRCGDAGVGAAKSGFLATNTDWTLINGTYTTGSAENYLPMMYLVLENITTGKAYLDYFWMEEDKGGGIYGPNIISKPSMSHYQYVDQRNSFAFDKMLDLAHQNEIYLKIVGLEKNDVIANLTNFDGSVGTNEQNNGNFYGNYGQQTKIYWLQQAWWRYQQARWGYSPNIHSWELINEGDPGNGNLWKLTDEMGRFMHCRIFGVTIGIQDGVKCNFDHPNDHLVTTSFWSQYPRQFWTGSQWPNVDYADIHAYISTSWADTVTKNLMKFDEALYHQWHSQQVGMGTNSPNKPVMRGEAGLDEYNLQSDTVLNLAADTRKIWMHNYLWSQLYPGGLYEEYWWWREHMTGIGGVFDPENRFAKFLTFIKNIPLSNGNYVDAAATSNNSQLRVWGQKDTVNNRAHLWIQNSRHTWKNVVDNVNINAITAIVNISGFASNRSLKVEWWDTYSGTISRTENIVTNSQGQLALPIPNLTTDTAVKIGDYTNIISPTVTVVPTVTNLLGDINGDRVVNILDFTMLSNAFGTNNSAADLNDDGVVNILDFTILSNNFGRGS